MQILVGPDLQNQFVAVPLHYAVNQDSKAVRCRCMVEGSFLPLLKDKITDQKLNSCLAIQSWNSFFEDFHNISLYVVEGKEKYKRDRI